LRKRTLYVTFDGLSDPLGQSQILPYLLGISQSGYAPTIISCEKGERLEREKEGIQKRLLAAGISWRYILYDEKGGFLSRIFYVRKVTKLAIKEHLLNNFKLVHCRSYLAALIGLKLKQKFGMPFLFDMRGFWADERLDGKIWNTRNPLHAFFYSYFKLREKQFLSQADKVVSLTHAAVKHLDLTFPSDKILSKTIVVPCCVNLEVFDPTQVHDNISDYQYLKNHHTLIYTGSIGTWYCTKEMIDCVLRWRTFQPDIKLLIVTRDLKALENIVSEYRAEEREVLVITSASYAQIPELLSLAKAAIFFIKPAFSKMASSPTKMAECWAMNLPIVTNRGVGDNDLYFNQLSGGVLIEEFSDAEYDNAYQRYSKLAAAANYRKIAQAHFNTAEAVKSYLSVYDALTEK
jgi:glycosyltransferase involved in cell wall biosynthesis